MAEQNHIQDPNLGEEENGGFSLKDIWFIVLLHWPWIILSIIICFACAFLYLRFQTPTYQANAKILVKDDKNNKNNSAGMLNLAEMGIVSNTDGFDNELEILSSTTISNSIVKTLNLNIQYFVDGGFRELELYKCSPITVSMSEEEMNALNTYVELTITPEDKNYHLRAEIETKDPKHPLVKEFVITGFPSEINSPVGTFRFESNAELAQFDKDELIVRIYPIIDMGKYYARKLGAQASSKTTTVAALSIIDSQPERAIDYLNQLMESYNADANADKNEVASKTKDFIDERIKVIGDELSATEKNLEQYKKQNELINLTNDATKALETTTDYQKEQTEIQTELSMVKSLIDYVNNPSNVDQVIPATASLGIKDAMLNTQVSSYNESLLQYNRLSKIGGDNNPAVTKLGEEVSAMRIAVAQSLRNVYSDLQVQKRSIDSQYALFSGKISNTPTQERVLNDIGRQQEIKASLYLTLLQKREENLISLASTATKAKWLDEPLVDPSPVSPKRRIIWLLALVLGVCLPIGIYYLLEKMRYRIEGRSDIEKLTKIPIVADLPLTHMPKGKERAIVVLENCNDTMEESFRGLRTNMRFIMGSDKNVIVCTSTIPGEGKTFVCTNLAMSYALLGKKVLVVGLDIRKPQLVRLFDLPSDKRGITNFLADENAGFDYLEEQIHRGIMNPNLDVMPAGIIPPNPGELISRDRLDKAINYLREKYDIVLLDTAPVGLVSDTIEIGRVADATIFVCRADYSPKSNFELLNTINGENKLPKISLVLNGVDLQQKKYGYYYGTYGKYGKYGKYGYGHYGHYGTYGNYGHSGNVNRGKNHTEK